MANMKDGVSILVGTCAGAEYVLLYIKISQVVGKTYRPKDVYSEYDFPPDCFPF